MKATTFEFYARRQGKYCFYCKTTLNAGSATRDHYIPKSLGGKGNIRLACGLCNKMKTNIHPTVYLERLRILFFNYYQRELQRC